MGMIQTIGFIGHARVHVSDDLCHMGQWSVMRLWSANWYGNKWLAFPEASQFIGGLWLKIWSLLWFWMRRREAERQFAYVCKCQADGAKFLLGWRDSSVEWKEAEIILKKTSARPYDNFYMVSFTWNWIYKALHHTFRPEEGNTELENLEIVTLLWESCLWCTIWQHLIPTCLD